jgi:hypothetical protein
MLSAILAVLALAAANGVKAQTVGDLVSGIQNTCPEFAAALASPDFSTLATLLTQAAGAQLPSFDGKKEVIVLPTNQAFADLLASSGVTAEDFIASDLFAPTLLAHIGVAANNGASTATTANGSKLAFYQGADKATKLPLMQIPLGTTQTSALVQGPMSQSAVSQVINCDGNKYGMVTDKVLKPKAAGSAVIAEAPAVMDAVMEVVPMPGMMPETVTPEVPVVPEMPVEMPVAPPVVEEVAPIMAEVPSVVDVVADAPMVDMPTVGPIVPADAAVSVKVIASCAAALGAAAFL